jgi:hypothetical protein
MSGSVVLVIVLALIAPSASAGETACWFDNGAIVVPAAFGDIAGDFILDLSAARSSLHTAVAGSAGIEGDSARRTLILAGRRRPRFTMTIADLDANDRGFVTGISGIIGADAMKGLVVDIAAAPCRVRLARRPRPLSRAIRLRLRQIAGVPAFRAAISDGLTSRSGWFAIDTGRVGARIADAKFSRTPPPDALEPPARLRALSLGGRLFEQVPAGLDPPAGLGGAIGEAVWSRYRLRIDVSNGWLDLAPENPSSRASLSYR